MYVNSDTMYKDVICDDDNIRGLWCCAGAESLYAIKVHLYQFKLDC